MFKSQMQWVIEQLDTKGQVTRNSALKRNITRLASCIKNLNYVGWEILGHWENQNRKGDYIYVLTKNKPKKK